MEPMTELVVGTLKLEGTADAVTREQAADLLPLWQVYRDLSTSDTAAQAEIDGLTAQIQATLTDAQRKSISAMKLTQEDVLAVIQEQAPDMASGPVARGDSNTRGTDNPFSGGGPPTGMMFVGPDGGGMMPGGGPGGGVQTTGTPQANGQQLRGRRAGGMPTPLLNALIKYLEAKAAS
jgi:hypothetical protein